VIHLHPRRRLCVPPRQPLGHLDSPADASQRRLHGWPADPKGQLLKRRAKTMQAGPPYALRAGALVPAVKESVSKTIRDQSE